MHPSHPVQPLRGTPDPQPTRSGREFDSLQLHGGSSHLDAYAKFIVHEGGDVVSVQIIDARTDEVIREIPPKEVLQIREQLAAYQAAHARRVG